MPVKKPRKADKRSQGEFEKEIEKRVEDFGEEVGRVFGRAGKKAEAHGRSYEHWFGRAFGVAGAVLSAIIGMIFFAIGIFVLRFINGFLSIGLISAFTDFLAANAGIFLLIFLFSGFAKYVSCVNRRIYNAFMPWVAGVTIVIIAWVASEFIFIANAYVMSSALAGVGFWLQANCGVLFWIFVVLGYLFLMLREAPPHYVLTGRIVPGREERETGKEGPERVKRLYRSGKDKILGGVCGGIAEYLGVDPVIIRLLWIIPTLAWGTGIIAYIIAWIIIPRNPAHRWG